MDKKQIISFLALNGYDIHTISDLLEDETITNEDKTTFVNVLAKMTEYSTQRAYSNLKKNGV